MTSNNDLKVKAFQVRDEVLEGKNTAYRIGQLFADIIDRLVIILQSEDPVEKANDSNVFSAYASLTHFLRKNAEDVATELLKFLRGAEFGEFVSNMQSGTGAKIWENGHAEFMSVAIRQWLEVPDIKYNRTRIVGGELWITDGAKFDTVTPIGELFLVALKLEKGELISLVTGDILKGAFQEQNENGDFAGFRTLWFRVMAVDQNNQTITVASRYPGNEKYNPRQFLEVARIGSFTDESRQHSILIDSKESCITFLDHVNSWDITPEMEMCWLGKKERNIPGVPSTKNYNARLANVIMSGKIFQYDESSGDDFLIPIDKGAYIPGIHYSYYNRVSSDGGLWLCINENGSSSTPSLNNADWLLQVADGSYTKFQFAVNSSLTEAPQTGWQDIPPVVEAEQYLWMRTGIVIPPATEPEKWNAVRLGGQKGETGDIKLNHLSEDYSPYIEYKAGDVIRFNQGKIYCKKDNKGKTPVPFLMTGGKYLMTGGSYLLALPLSIENLNNEYWEIFQDKPIIRATRWLSSNTPVVRFNSIGNPVPSAIVVNCKRIRDGYPVEDCADLWIVYRTYGDTTYIRQSTPIKTTSITIANLRTDGIYYVRGYEFQEDAEAWNDNFCTEYTITHANDGIGKTGAMPRIRGIWNSTVADYVWNDKWQDIVLVSVNGVSMKFAVKVSGTVPANIHPTSSAGGTYWESAQQHEFIATDTMLADGANIAGFMYKDQKMISRDTDPITGLPNLSLNGNTGEIIALKGIFSGYLKLPFIDITESDAIPMASGGYILWNNLNVICHGELVVLPVVPDFAGRIVSIFDNQWPPYTKSLQITTVTTQDGQRLNRNTTPFEIDDSEFKSSVQVLGGVARFIAVWGRADNEGATRCIRWTLLN